MAAARALAVEVGGDGVRVNSVSPGTIDTPMLRRDLEGMNVDEADAFLGRVEGANALGRDRAARGGRVGGRLALLARGVVRHGHGPGGRRRLPARQALLTARGNRRAAAPVTSGNRSRSRQCPAAPSSPSPPSPPLPPPGPCPPRAPTRMRATAPPSSARRPWSATSGSVDLAARQGLDVLDVTWEDTGRFLDSSVGPNISDMTIQVQTCDEEQQRPGAASSTCMPVIRFPNFSDKTGDVPLDDFSVLVGNEKGEAAASACRCRTSSATSAATCTTPTRGAAGRTSLLAPRDTHVLVSAQAASCPCPRGGEAPSSTRCSSTTSPCRATRPC